MLTGVTDKDKTEGKYPELIASLAFNEQNANSFLYKLSCLYGLSCHNWLSNTYVEHVNINSDCFMSQKDLF